MPAGLPHDTPKLVCVAAALIESAIGSVDSADMKDNRRGCTDQDVGSAISPHVNDAELDVAGELPDEGIDTELSRHGCMNRSTLNSDASHMKATATGLVAPAASHRHELTHEREATGHVRRARHHRGDAGLRHLPA